jgi:PAS domain-containing protein
VNFLRKPIDIEQMLLAIERAIEFQTARRSLLYRNRDLELMRQLVVRLTEELESLVKGSEPVSGEAASFLQTLVHALPFGIVVADANRRVLFANRQGLGSSNETPVISLADWLRREGATAVGAVAVDEAFARLVQAKPGAVETQDLSEDTHLIMTSLNRPAGDDTAPFFLLAVGCNRRGSGAR